MSNYNPLTNFTAKDSLTTGDPQKIIRGADFDAEFDSISTAVNSKADANNAALTGSSSAVNLDITGTFELGGTAVTATATELNILDGVTSTTAELNLLDGVTASTAELNLLDGVTASTAELNLLDGVTATTAELNQLDGNVFTADLTIPDKIIHAGDTNTAIRFPAADTWAVETAGSERFRVASNGNVGIDINNPVGRLELGSGQFIAAGRGDATSGSETAPSIGLGDDDTGFFRPAFNTVAITCQGSERMRIDSSGNVGIGTTSPGQPLRVVGASGSAQFGAGTSDNAVFINAFDSNPIYMTASATNSTAFGFGAASNIPLFFMTNNTERMRIDSSGRVGIGTTNPATKFQAVGNATVLGKANVTAALYASESSGIDVPLLLGSTSGNRPFIGAFDGATTSVGSLDFFVDDASSPRIRITNTGNVGIGTTSPTSALTVSGRIETVDGADIDMDGSASGHLMLDGAGYGAAIALNAQGANFYTNSASRGIIFGVNETEVMRVTNGSVGIGTSSPSSYASSADDLVIGNSSGGDQGITIVTGTSNKGNLFFADGTTGNDVLRGAIQYDHSTNKLLLSTDATVRCFVEDDGSFSVGYASGGSSTAYVVRAVGFNTKAGTGAGLGTNAFNIEWSSPDANLWIDGTDLGAISTSSDYRIKRNVEDMEQGALARLKHVRPVTYQLADYGDLFKASDDIKEGFIAHELAEVIPSAVKGEKDDPDHIQSLKLDALCAVMAKAIQEQQEIIEQLTARVAELESKV